MFDAGLWSVDADLRVIVRAHRFSEAGSHAQQLRAHAGRHLQFAPQTKLRPAGELGDSEIAVELASAAIKGARAHGLRPESISLEAWGCHLLSGLHRFGSGADQSQEARERVAKTKTYGYDLWEIVRSIEHDLSELRPKRRPARQRVAGFDAGALHETRNLGSSEGELMPAFRLMRLLERAPCPISCDFLNFFATSASHAAVWLENAAPSWALSTLLRVDPREDLLQERRDAQTGTGSGFVRGAAASDRRGNGSDQSGYVRSTQRYGATHGEGGAGVIVTDRDARLPGDAQDLARHLRDLVEQSQSGGDV